LEERQHAMNSLLRMNCIPVAMELFPADGNTAWQYIQQVIADCDYYVLIIGGRYGSVAEDGVSYTEKEYDFAQSLGIPIFAFAHKQPDKLPGDKLELDPAIREKLESFRKKVATNHTWREWLTSEELAKEVAVTLAYAKTSTPREGWVRARFAINAETLNEVEQLRRAARTAAEKASQADLSDSERENFNAKIAQLKEELNRASEISKRLDIVRARLCEQAKYGRDVNTVGEMTAWMSATQDLVRGLFKTTIANKLHSGFPAGAHRDDRPLSASERASLQKSMASLRVIEGTLKADDLR
jgi:hypothetical protein